MSLRPNGGHDNFYVYIIQVYFDKMPNVNLPYVNYVTFDELTTISVQVIQILIFLDLKN